MTGFSHVLLSSLDAARTEFPWKLLNLYLGCFVQRFAEERALGCVNPRRVTQPRVCCLPNCVDTFDPLFSCHESLISGEWEVKFNFSPSQRKKPFKSRQKEKKQLSKSHSRVDFARRTRANEGYKRALLGVKEED